jgi:hypothetical protein
MDGTDDEAIRQAFPHATPGKSSGTRSWEQASYPLDAWPSER